jgi:FKBP-type peptidyl-prolyl cis-trans isomerase FklB
MRSKQLIIVAALGLTALLAGAVFAQQSTPQSSGTSQASGAQSATTSKPAAQSSSSSTAKSSQSGTKSSQTTAKKPSTAAKTTPFTLKTPKDKNSYAVGLFFGNQLHQSGVDLDTIDPAVFARAIKDALAGEKPLLTPEEQRTLLTQLQTDLRAKQQAKMQQLAVSNKTAGDAFLAENKAKDGVVTMPSGLEYKVLQEGTGPKPTADDSVVCNYRGSLLDGTEFDSSYKHGQPATFPVKGVIRGWTEALQLMPVGSKWQLVIPPDLAYGERGAGQQIGPNATLVFEVELLSIQQKAEAPAAAKPANPAAPPPTTQNPAQKPPEPQTPPPPKPPR